MNTHNPDCKCGSCVTVLSRDEIARFRVLSLRGALRLEVSGMKRSRGPSAFSMVKKEFGFQGDKKAVLDQLNRWIELNILTDAPALLKRQAN